MKKLFDKTFTVLIFSWVALQYVSCQKDIQKTTAEGLIPAIQNTWMDLKAKNLIHGSILITKDDQIIFADGPVEKIFSIASVSKSFVGAKFTELEKQGLDLNTPACQWLKNFCSGNLGKITLKHLLQHRSGFGRDLSIVHAIKRLINPDGDLKNIDSLKINDNSLKSEPGSKRTYSNFGYLMLSRILEIIEQKDFKDIISDLSAKSGLKHTAAIKKGDVLPIYILMPFSSVSAAWNVENRLYESAGTGGIKSSVRDLIRWIDFSVYKTSEDYDRGWVRSQDQTYQAYWHNGATFGSYSLIAILPEQKIKIALSIDNFKLTKQWSEMAEQFEQYFY